MLYERYNFDWKGVGSKITYIFLPHGSVILSTMYEL